MALPAPAPTDPSQPDPSADMGDADEAQGSGGYCIELHVGADGSLSVSVEDEDDETQKEGGDATGAPGAAAAPGGDIDKGTPAATVKEALQMILDIYKSNGKGQPGASLGKKLQSAGFAQGYNED